MHMTKWEDSMAKMDGSHLHSQSLNLWIRLWALVCACMRRLYCSLKIPPTFTKAELADIKYGKAPGAALLPKLTSQTGCCNVCESVRIQDSWSQLCLTTHWLPNDLCGSLWATMHINIYIYLVHLGGIKKESFGEKTPFYNKSQKKHPRAEIDYAVLWWAIWLSTCLSLVASAQAPSIASFLTWWTFDFLTIDEWSTEHLQTGPIAKRNEKILQDIPPPKKCEVSRSIFWRIYMSHPSSCPVLVQVMSMEALLAILWHWGQDILIKVKSPNT